MRRAWVEIEHGINNFIQEVVALHAEGVGRNFVVVTKFDKRNLSPSMRRAWVEI